MKNLSDVVTSEVFFYALRKRWCVISRDKRGDTIAVELFRTRQGAVAYSETIDHAWGSTTKKFTKDQSLAVEKRTILEMK